MDVISLLDRLSKFEAAAKSQSPNLHPRSLSRPMLPTELRLRQAELVAAFGVKRPSDLPRKTRVAIVVCARVHRGVDSYGTMAGKAGVLIKRLSQKHEIVPVTATHKVPSFVDTNEPDSESDAERFTRLASEAESRELQSDCVELQHQCWDLACKLRIRDECPVLPTGFKSLPLEELRAFHARLAGKRAEWSARIETVRATEEKERAFREERRQLFNTAVKLKNEVVALAREKYVRIDFVQVPSPDKLGIEKLKEIVSKLESFKVTIEKRSKMHVSNARPLPSPLAA